MSADREPTLEEAIAASRDFDQLEAQDRIDEFAGRALQGMLANPGAGWGERAAAESAYDFAEAMEAERAKRLAKTADPEPTPEEIAWEKSTRKNEEDRQEGR